MNTEFKIGINKIEIIDDYKYLGVCFSKTRSFLKARKSLIDCAKKAMFALRVKIRNLDIPIDLQLKLFDHTVLPILLYGSEIWGFENTDMIEKVHLDFLKRILKVKKSTPSCFVYGELGRYPLEIDIKCRIINFWFKIVNGKQNKLSNIMFKLLLHDKETGFYNHKWILHVEKF